MSAVGVCRGPRSTVSRVWSMFHWSDGRGCSRRAFSSVETGTRTSRPSREISSAFGTILTATGSRSVILIRLLLIAKMLLMVWRQCKVTLLRRTLLQLLHQVLIGSSGWHRLNCIMAINRLLLNLLLLGCIIDAACCYWPTSVVFLLSVGLSFGK